MANISEQLKNAEISSELESSSTPRYSNLEWRFETQLAERSLREQLSQPSVVLRFNLMDCNGCNKYVTLRCDVANLYHTREVLEEALAQSRAHHLLNIKRLIK